MGDQLQLMICTLFCHLNIGIVGSNHTQGMNVCLSCLCVVLRQTHALQWTDPLSNEFYQMSRNHIQEL